MRILIALILLTVCLPGCVSSRRPEPFTGPAVLAEVSHHVGTSLEGPATLLAAPGGGEFRHVTFRTYALERSEPGALEPILGHTTLVLRRTDDTPFLPAPRLLRETRCAFGPTARDNMLLGIQDGRFGGTDPIPLKEGVIAPGTTLEFELLGEGTSVGIRISIQGQPYGAAARIGLAVAQVVTPLPPIDSATAAEGDEDPGALEEELAKARIEDEALASLVREAVFLEPADLEAPLVITVLFASPFPTDGGEAILVVIEVTAPAGPGTPEREMHDQLVEEFRRTTGGRAAREQSDRILSPIPRALSSGLDSVLAGFEDPDRQRNALAWLALATGAVITEDLALMAKDESIEMLAELILAEASELTRPLDPGAMGILCERISGGLLLRYATRRDPPPGIDSLLLRHTGEVGRHPAMLEEALASEKSVAGLHDRLVHENRLFLEDNSPASRVRAFDWLSLVGSAPKGFDPLADRKARRTALEGWYESQATGGGR